MRDAASWDMEAVDHLRTLLRFDTTNPPGNEMQAATYLADVLREEGLEPTVIESSPRRGNVVCRYRGTGDEEPLLLYGHLDVVTAEPDQWTHPPFAADVADGCVWGRGALDMKGMVTQELMIMLLLKRREARLRRDVIFAATADEEMGGRDGLGFLVDHHRDLIHAEYGLSEGAGTTTYVSGVPIYDVRTAEKGTCRFVLTARGEPGHASVPRPGTAVERVAAAVTALIENPLPLRPTSTTKAYFRVLAEASGMPGGRHDLSAANLDAAKGYLPGELWHYLNAVARDTAMPTGLRAGEKINVIPGKAEARVDGRYVPGQTVEGFLEEVRAVIGDEVEIEPLERVTEPLEGAPEGPLWMAIVDAIRKAAPEALVSPVMLSGATDAKHAVRMGTTCWGFGALRVDESFPAERLVHGHDERIPIDGFLWGVDVLYDIVSSFCAHGA